MRRSSDILSGRLPRLAAAIASGALLTTAYPPRQAGWVVWFWMIPLLLALWSGDPLRTATTKSRIGSGLLLGFAAGLSFFLPNLSWVRHSSRVIHGATDDRWIGWPAELMGWSAVLALSAYLALYWAAWGAFAATVGRPRIGSLCARPAPEAEGAWFSLSLESLRSAFLNAALWTGLEWLRGIVMTGFTWNGLAVPLASELALVQAADLVGVTGLSFLPVFVAGIAFNTALRFREEARTARVRPHLDFFCAVLLVLADFIYGFRHLSASRGAEAIALQVLLVQQNIPQATKWSHEEDEAIYHGYDRLTRLFATGGTARPPDLVIWPESALPLHFHHPAHRQFLDNLLAAGDFSLLTGTDLVEDGRPHYTGAALVRGSLANPQLYRKVHLVPFGEYLPLRSIPIVQKVLGSVLPGDFAPGRSTEPLRLAKPAGVQVIPLICFEDTIGRLARKFVRRAPQLLVNCTNDGWFLQSPENEHHLANAIFRCIELRRPMARAANTGVTCIVGPDGRIREGDRLVDPKTRSVFTRGALSREILLEKNPPLTFYARHGDLFSVVMLAAAGLGLAATLINRRLRGPVKETE